MPPGFDPHASARLSFIAGQARRLVAPLLPLFLLFLANGELRAQAPLQGGYGGIGFRCALRDHDAFARRQAIGLEHQGVAETA